MASDQAVAALFAGVGEVSTGTTHPALAFPTRGLTVALVAAPLWLRRASLGWSRYNGCMNSRPLDPPPEPDAPEPSAAKLDAAKLDAEALEALREASGIALSADGIFQYRGDRVPNDRVQDLFHRGLRVRQDGRVTLHVGRQWCYVDAAGVGRFVAGVRVVGEKLRLRMRPGEELELAPGSFVLGAAPDGRFYAWAPREAPPAVLLRGAHQQLAGLLDVREGAAGEASGDVLILRVGDVEVPVLSLPEVPALTAPAPHRG